MMLLRSVLWRAGLTAAVALFAAAAPATTTSMRAIRPPRGQAEEVGIASVYARSFVGKKTATGTIFKPDKLTAASRTLPLDSKAQVTDLETGKSTEVTINDRGPYKSGRVIDLSPKAARSVGLSKNEGLAPVVVKPIAPPTSDSNVASAKD